MSNNAKNADARRSHAGAWVAVLVILVIACACAAIVIIRPPFAEGALSALGIPRIGGAPGQASSSSAATQTFSDVNDVTPTQSQAAELLEQEKLTKRTPLLARCSGVDIRSSIRPADITGILFHQASLEYGLVVETELPEADAEEAADKRSLRVNHEQKDGEWLDAEVLHLWRTADDTEMDTSIDLGAMAGTTVLAPVDGTVVLVRDYMLYDEVPDVEIHIQPDGRPDLDCVLIHTTDPVVKAGDRVEAGITPLSKVRDIEESLTDVQLAFFLPEDVGGNHVHIQMNDANYPDYRKKKLEGAITVK